MRGTSPATEVSRTIEIEEPDTLFALHMAIQYAFDWDNDHPYAFYMSNVPYDSGSEYSGDPIRSVPIRA